MPIMNMVRTIKELFPNYILLVKVGVFYNAYMDDATIVNHIFNYKIKTISGMDMVGFPKESLNKVLCLLEKRTINYIVVDKSNNYEEETKLNLKQNNKYESIKQEATEIRDRKQKVTKISNFLMKNPNKIIEFERILYEGKL